MQLKIYNAENASRKSSSTTPFISLPKNGGLIYLSKATVELIKLKDGDKICIAQDPQNVLDWYIYKSEDGFSLRPSGEDSSRLAFNSSLVSEDLRACAPASVDTEKSIKMPIAKESVTFKGDKNIYWPIITKGAY